MEDIFPTGKHFKNIPLLVFLLYIPPQQYVLILIILVYKAESNIHFCPIGFYVIGSSHKLCISMIK